MDKNKVKLNFADLLDKKIMPSEFRIQKTGGVSKDAKRETQEATAPAEFSSPNRSRFYNIPRTHH